MMLIGRYRYARGGRLPNLPANFWDFLALTAAGAFSVNILSHLQSAQGAIHQNYSAPGIPLGVFAKAMRTATLCLESDE